MKQELIELGVSDAYLAELRKEWEIVPDCSETAGYNSVRLGLGKIVKARTGIEKKRVLLTKPLLQRKKSIDSEAKRLTMELAKIETPLKDAKQAEDNRLEMIKQEEIRKEAKRQERITAKIQSFGQLVLDSLGGSADDLEHALDVLRATDTEDCDERKEVADKTLATSIESLDAALVARRAAEELKRREDEIAAKEKAQEEEAVRQKKKAEELAAEEARQKALDEAREQEEAERVEATRIAEEKEVEQQRQAPPPNIPSLQIPGVSSGDYAGPQGASTMGLMRSKGLNADEDAYNQEPNIDQFNDRFDEAVETIKKCFIDQDEEPQDGATEVVHTIIRGDIPWVSWNG